MNGWPVAKSNPIPQSVGDDVKRSMLAAKPKAATIAVTARVSPMIALRTGVALRPCPGSSASLVPATADTGKPNVAAAEAIREWRSLPENSVVPSIEPASLEVRHAGIPTQAITAMTMATAPTTRMPGSTKTPGAASKIRESPSGVSTDNASAPATAMAAPSRATATAGSRAARTSWPRLIPSARSTGASVAASKVRRTRTCPSTRSAASAASPPKRRSITDWREVARSAIVRSVEVSNPKDAGAICLAPVQNAAVPSAPPDSWNIPASQPSASSRYLSENAGTTPKEPDVPSSSPGMIAVPTTFRGTVIRSSSVSSSPPAIFPNASDFGIFTSIVSPSTGRRARPSSPHPINTSSAVRGYRPESSSGRTESGSSRSKAFRVPSKLGSG